MIGFVLQPLNVAACVADGSETVASTPAIWDEPDGTWTALGFGDDSVASVSFGLTFPFLGTDYTSGWVSSNGFISLDSDIGPQCCDACIIEFFTNSSAQISVGWRDLNASTNGGFDGGDVKHKQFSDHITITWDKVPEFSNISPFVNQFQMQLYTSGRIVFGYKQIQPECRNPGGHRHHAIIGVTPGGLTCTGPVSCSNPVQECNEGPSETDYSTVLPFDSGTNQVVYETFARGPNGSTATGGDTFDINGTNICFIPNGSNGWNVTTDCASDTGDWGWTHRP